MLCVYNRRKKGEPTCCLSCSMLQLMVSTGGKLFTLTHKYIHVADVNVRVFVCLSMYIGMHMHPCNNGAHAFKKCKISISCSVYAAALPHALVDVHVFLAPSTPSNQDIVGTENQGVQTRLSCSALIGLINSPRVRTGITHHALGVGTSYDNDCRTNSPNDTRGSGAE